MRQIFKATIATQLLFLASLSAVVPASASTFDGQWNVQIASPKESCGSGTTVAIGISNGQVASNNAMVTASGRVAEAGTISVTLASGMKKAIGSGHLSATSGSGTWHGTMCSGTWVAQRN
jgi:hypothetical protein